ncbi:uncharacterized protein DNG_03760 [Cephalotrichum gorgonifer]|uniref:Endonuclease/exonuclease/phosphatase domain-containing protein n=1 Tax=Cephalotrichum gorgonifer TaxID=2041049 RepID=A0AAE8MX78_9PEZI|nr:uncharacterized protein DNG_03760 [Cephalotrichum gorgonifer]
MASHKLWRTLSAFNHSARRWVPIPSSNAQHEVTEKPPLTPPSRPLPNVDGISPPKKLSLVSWNIDTFSPRPAARSKLILNHVLEVPEAPDIIFLQEVTLGTRDSLLNDARVRDGFLVTDAEGVASFKTNEDDEIGGRGSGKLVLGHISRITLPSKYKRDALSVDFIPPTVPDSVLRLINVHLDSLGDAIHYRAQQMEILANVLREPGCSGGIIAGDFNAISPEDGMLIHKNNLVDAWVALHGTADTNEAACTWGVGMKLRDGLAPGRLDKIAMLGVEPETIEVLRPSSIEVPRPGEESPSIPWSDHCGLRCTFAI